MPVLAHRTSAQDGRYRPTPSGPGVDETLATLGQIRQIHVVRAEEDPEILSQAVVHIAIRQGSVTLLPPLVPPAVPDEQTLFGIVVAHRHHGVSADHMIARTWVRYIP